VLLLVTAPIGGVWRCRRRASRIRARDRQTRHTRTSPTTRSARMIGANVVVQHLYMLPHLVSAVRRKTVKGNCRVVCRSERDEGRCRTTRSAGAPQTCNDAWNTPATNRERQIARNDGSEKNDAEEYKWETDPSRDSTARALQPPARSKVVGHFANRLFVRLSPANTRAGGAGPTTHALSRAAGPERLAR
jgi:hypothetical protein